MIFLVRKQQYCKLLRFFIYFIHSFIEQKSDLPHKTHYN